MMASIFERLVGKGRSGKTGADRIAEIISELDGLDGELAKIAATLSAHSAKRDDLLSNPEVSDQEILAHDLAADRAHLARERVESVQARLRDELHALQDELAEAAYRDAFDARHAALTAFAAAKEAAVERLRELHDAHAQFDAVAQQARRKADHWGDGGPLILAPEVVENFRRRLEQARQHEDARRARIDGGEQ